MNKYILLYEVEAPDEVELQKLIGEIESETGMTPIAVKNEYGDEISTFD